MVRGGIRKKVRTKRLRISRGTRAEIEPFYSSNISKIYK